MNDRNWACKFLAKFSTPEVGRHNSSALEMRRKVAHAANQWIAGCDTAQVVANNPNTIPLAGPSALCPTAQVPYFVRDESHIVWLRDPSIYDYLRESTTYFNFRVKFPLKSMNPATHTDGGPLSHIVAYACLKPTALSDSIMGGRSGLFTRRYWWVKSYDRFTGHGYYRGRSSPDDPRFYATGAPAEAVLVSSIAPGRPSNPGPDDS